MITGPSRSRWFGEELLDHVGQPVEGVPERRGRGRVAQAEAGVVGRDRVEPIAERRDQVAVRNDRLGA
jgi:hypothetical protein